MTDKKFSIIEALGFGWNSMKARLGFFIGLLLLLAVLNGGPSLVSHLFKAGAGVAVEGGGILPGLRVGLNLLSVIVMIAGVVIQIITTMGMIRITLKCCDGEEPRYGDLFSYAQLFFTYLGAGILYGLAMALILVAPLLALITYARAAALSAMATVDIAVVLAIPGIYLAIRLSLFGYCIVDGGLGAIESLKKSFALSSGAVFRLGLFYLATMLINMAGGLCLVVGLFATIPTTYIATAFVYRKLAAPSTEGFMGRMGPTAEGMPCNR